MATIHATTRTGAGKGVARRLRIADPEQIPAVLYGGGQPNINLTLVLRDWLMIMNRERLELKKNPHELIVDGGEPIPVVIRGMQIHALTGRPMHVDFFRGTL